MCVRAGAVTCDAAIWPPTPGPRTKSTERQSTAGSGCGFAEQVGGRRQRRGRTAGQGSRSRHSTHHELLPELRRRDERLAQQLYGLLLLRPQPGLGGGAGRGGGVHEVLYPRDHGAVGEVRAALAQHLRVGVRCVWAGPVLGQGLCWTRVGRRAGVQGCRLACRQAGVKGEVTCSGRGSGSSSRMTWQVECSGRGDGSSRRMTRQVAEELVAAVERPGCCSRAPAAHLGELPVHLLQLVLLRRHVARPLGVVTLQHRPAAVAALVLRVRGQTHGGACGGARAHRPGTRAHPVCVWVGSAAQLRREPTHLLP